MLAMMLVQAMAATGGQPRPIDLHPRWTASREECVSEHPAMDDDAILVCGRRDADNRYRLEPLDASRYEPKRRAETTLAGNLKGAAEVEREEIAPGMTSSRIMFRLKLPF